MPDFVEREGDLIVRTSVKNRLVVEERIQDVQPVLDKNKALATHDSGYSPDKTLKRMASIPLIVVERWLKEGVDIYNPDHAGEVRRRLNSSDWAYLRTSEGRL